jgi:hypothetical protein
MATLSATDARSNLYRLIDQTSLPAKEGTLFLSLKRAGNQFKRPCFF